MHLILEGLYSARVCSRSAISDLEISTMYHLAATNIPGPFYVCTWFTELDRFVSLVIPEPRG